MIRYVTFMCNATPWHIFFDSNVQRLLILPSNTIYRLWNTTESFKKILFNVFLRILFFITRFFTFFILRIYVFNIYGWDRARYGAHKDHLLINTERSISLWRHADAKQHMNTVSLESVCCLERSSLNQMASLVSYTHASSTFAWRLKRSAVDTSAHTEWM